LELLAELAALVFQFLFELLLQIVFEILAELGLEAVRVAIRPTKQSRPSWVLVGYVLLGGSLGAVSLLVFPHKFAIPIWLQLLNVGLTPMIVGVSMVGIGRWRRRRNQPALLLHKFSIGFLVALVFALVRLIFAT
jgi:hypothetical protein